MFLVLNTLSQSSHTRETIVCSDVAPKLASSLTVPAESAVEDDKIDRMLSRVLQAGVARADMPPPVLGGVL